MSMPNSPSNMACPNCQHLLCVCNQLIWPSPSALSLHLRLRIPLFELRRSASIIMDSAEAQARSFSVRNFARLTSWHVWHNLHQQLAFAVTRSPVSFMVLLGLTPMTGHDQMLSAQHWICAVFWNSSQFPKTNQNQMGLPCSMLMPCAKLAHSVWIVWKYLSPLLIQCCQALEMSGTNLPTEYDNADLGRFHPYELTMF